MSDPRFVPRDFCDDPSAFGKVRDIPWVTPDPKDLHLLHAATLQHFFAWRIRSELRKSGRSAKSYATFAHTSYDRLMKMLRGEVIMRMEDLGRAQAFFGVEILFRNFSPPQEITRRAPRKRIG